MAKRKKKSILIAADNAMLARSRAASRLNVAPDSVELKPAGAGQFFASVKDQSSRVQVAIAPDGLTAWVTAISPPVGAGSLASFSDIKDSLRDAGVSHGLDMDAVKVLAQRVRMEGKVEDRIQIATGTPPEEQGSDLELLVEEGDLVLKGTTIARKAPAEEGAGWGVKVTGEKIPPVRTEQVDPAEGVVVADDQVTMIAGETGFVVVRDGKLMVKPVLQVSKDSMEARITVFPPRPGRRMLSVAGIERILEENHVVHGVDKDAIRDTVARVEATNEPVESVVVARGKPAKHGDDGRLDYQVDLTEKVGLELEDGRMNYYERNLITNVREGQVLIHKVPATQGEDGRNVMGVRISARDGREAMLKGGDNVEVGEDGRIFRSAIEGCVCIADDVVSVVDTYEVHSDVDFNTGNIDYSGFLKVFGTIRSNFSVKAKTHVEVHGTVEEARVEAGGDITVNGGVLMKGKDPEDEERERRVGIGNIPESLGSRGYLKAGGMANITFAVNAVVMAGKDIWVRNEAMNCALYTNGKVVAVDGKGTIIGGVVRAALGVEAKSLGSDAGVRTEIVVDLDKRDYDALKRMEQEAGDNEQEMAKIGRAISSGLLGKAEDVASGKKKEAVLKLLRYYKVLKNTTTELKFRREELLKLVEISRKGTVKVFGDIYPGVQVRIHGRPFRVEKHMKGAKFRLDPVEDKVVRVPL